MKRSSQFAALVFGLGLLVAAPALHAQEPVFCSNSTMSGTYVVTATGNIVTPAGLIPFADVGKITYNGNGGGTITWSTSSAGGATSKLSGPVTGTYTVNADCTGSKVFADGTHYDFVISPNGRLITFIVTNSGVVIYGSAVRLDNKD